MSWDDIARTVTRKLEGREAGGDHRKFIVTCPTCNEVLGQTWISRKKGRGKEAGDDIIRSVANFLGVTMPQFRAMERCTVSRDEYLSIRGHAHA